LTGSLIRALASLLDNASLLIASQDYDTLMAFEFQNILAMIIESIVSNHKVVISLHEPIINYLLPVLYSKVSQQITSSEDN